MWSSGSRRQLRLVGCITRGTGCLLSSGFKSSRGQLVASGKASFRILSARDASLERHYTCALLGLINLISLNPLHKCDKDYGCLDWGLINHIQFSNFPIVLVIYIHFVFRSNSYRVVTFDPEVMKKSKERQQQFLSLRKKSGLSTTVVKPIEETYHPHHGSVRIVHAQSANARPR